MSRIGSLRVNSSSLHWVTVPFLRSNRSCNQTCKRRSLGTLVRSTCLEAFFKIGALRNFAIFTGKQLHCSLFLKRDSNTIVLLWILQNLKEHLFLQNTSGGYFMLEPSKHLFRWRGVEYLLRRLQRNIFFVFQDMFARHLLVKVLKKMFCKHILKKSWRHLRIRLEDFLKTTWRSVFNHLKYQ